MLYMLDVSFEGCHSYECQTDSHNSYAFDAMSDDVIVFESNFTKNDGAINAITHHAFNLSYTTIQENGHSSIGSVISIAGISLSPINLTYFVGNQQCSKGLIFSSVDDDSELQIVKSAFKDNAGTLFYADSGVISISNSDFDTDSASTLFYGNVIFGDQVRYSATTNLKLPFVITKGCWAHSLYKWKDPKDSVKYTIIGLIAFFLLAAFALVMIHKQYHDKKVAEFNQSIIDVNVDAGSIIA